MYTCTLLTLLLFTTFVVAQTIPYQADLVGWYDFEEGGGSTLNDKSGFGTPMSMQISGSGYTWGGGGLTVPNNIGNVVAASSGSNKIMQAIINGGGSWSIRVIVSSSILDPTTLPTGATGLPLRIVVFSNSGGSCPWNQFIHIGHNAEGFVVRPLFSSVEGCTAPITKPRQLVVDTIYDLIVSYQDNGDGTVDVNTHLNSVGNGQKYLGVAKAGGWSLTDVTMKFFNDGSMDRQFHGTIYDVKIWRRAFTDTEVALVFTPPTTTPPPTTTTPPPTTTTPPPTTTTAPPTTTTTTPASTTTVVGAATSTTPGTIPTTSTAPATSPATSANSSSTPTQVNTSTQVPTPVVLTTRPPATNSSAIPTLSGAPPPPGALNGGTLAPKKSTKWTIIIVIAIIAIIALIIASAVVIYFACFKKASPRHKASFGYDESEMYANKLEEPLLEK